MVGVINEGSDSLDDYKSAASDASDSVSPDSPFGGADPTSKMTTALPSTASRTSTMTNPETTATDGGADPTSTPDAAVHLAGSGAAAAGLAVIMGGLLAM